MSTTVFHCSKERSSRLTPGAPTDGDGVLRGCAGRGDGLLERLLAPPGECDAITFVQQRGRNALADAGAGARDDGGLVVCAHDCLAPLGIEMPAWKPAA